ncbi:MAG: mannose-6-phosphate isomerase [Parcubacteria group bacterium 21-54-25]|nr:MAG: mannose-6-phosphate isomerase [Parcubacteria group bacterium 21-54-25]HQU07989.1 phosphomannose isomerase type II C-terminal cupin domain [Candidatus Paceibacterota bacterium]
MSLLAHRGHDDRPWGSFDRFTQNESSTVKLLTVAPNKRLSLQQHAHRSEYWRVISGSGSAHIGDKEYTAQPGDEFEVPTGTLHRLTAGPTGLLILEIALGDFDETDIVRLEDDFGRTAGP